MPLRVAAISFLNPAPLLFNFEHEPTATALRQHYSVHYTTPANCAAELHSGEADLGLIPIASLTPALTIVPGCTIASHDEVRSILLLVKNPHNLSQREALEQVRTVAGDAASRSSNAYARILFERFHNNRPDFLELPADPVAQLAAADAALLIGDPALLAREHRASIEAAANTPLLWLDLAQLWREHTGLPWVAAVWALRREALAEAHILPHQLIADLIHSRDAGLAHVDQIVAEWSPRLAVPAATIRTYLTHNIHYKLNAGCLRTIQQFRAFAAEINALPPLPALNILEP